MINKIYNLVNIGKISFPKDFNIIFSSDGKYLISPTLRDNHYFEMAGESMYYAISEYEKLYNIDLKSYKYRIVHALLNRFKECGNKLYHKSLSANFNDVQLRSTSSAIRILLLAHNDGFDVKNEIQILANLHFKYFLEYGNGLWFCHDSSEFFMRGPKTHIKSNVYNKMKHNTLTLNTHFDTLITLMLLKVNNLERILNFDIQSYIDKAILSINYICEIQSNNKSIQIIDNWFLNKYLSNSDNYFFKFYERLVHPILFKYISPTFFFKNGFIARDMSVLNRHIDYQLVNVADIARFISLFDKNESCFNVKYNDKLKYYLYNSINFIETNEKYKNYIFKDNINIAWYNDILVSISKTNSNFLNKDRKSYLDMNFCCYFNLV